MTILVQQDICEVETSKWYNLRQYMPQLFFLYVL